MADFEFLEHTADLKIRSYGSTLDAAFENAGRALFTASADLENVEAKVTKKINLEAEDLEVLLHDYLSELIYHFSVGHLLFTNFSVKIVKVATYQLHGTVAGEKYISGKHQLHKEVKAATYHEMKIENKDDKWVIEVVCDT